MPASMPPDMKKPIIPAQENKQSLTALDHTPDTLPTDIRQDLLFFLSHKSHLLALCLPDTIISCTVWAVMYCFIGMVWVHLIVKVARPFSLMAISLLLTNPGRSQSSFTVPSLNLLLFHPFVHKSTFVEYGEQTVLLLLHSGPDLHLIFPTVRPGIVRNILKPYRLFPGCLIDSDQLVF